MASATVLMMISVNKQYSKPRDVTSCQMRHRMTSRWKPTSTVSGRCQMRHCSFMVGTYRCCGRALSANSMHLRYITPKHTVSESGGGWGAGRRHGGPGGPLHPRTQPVAISRTTFIIRRVQTSGSVAEWLACWTQAQKGQGSNCSRDAVG